MSKRKGNFDHEKDGDHEKNDDQPVSSTLKSATATVPPYINNQTYKVDVCDEILENTNLLPDFVNRILVPYLEFSGVERCTLKGHTSGISSVAILPTGHFCSGSVDKSIKIWSRDGLCLQTLTGKKACKSPTYFVCS